MKYLVIELFTYIKLLETNDYLYALKYASEHMGYVLINNIKRKEVGDERKQLGLSN